MSKVRHALLVAGSTLAVAGTLAFSAPAFAEKIMPSPMPPQAPAASHHSAMKPAPKQAEDPVEARIAKLHSQLKITAAQEDQFKAVAQVMRDSRAAQESLMAEKQKAEETQTALDDLQAYAQIAQFHADEAKKMATAFEALYGSLSDDQKKAADEAFRAHKRHVMQNFMHHGAVPKKAPAAAPSAQ
ncbi:MAG TPA: Spy/CpxP family protein refolding chaperone [Candidatus Sulfotelmatobacter sp.]|nr:Spy/CpxP family protein refolding chaperone [Candidatus Sulfotelmatobacter sp.]